jgi:hypothetical protein
MPRRLKLTKFHVPNINYQYVGAYRLRVEATDPLGTGADPNVFVYLRAPENPDGSTDDYFQAVASPVDMSEYPAAAPTTGTPYPFFRLDYVELDFRAVSDADEALATIIREVDALLHALGKLDRLVPSEEFWVGEPAEAAGSSSSTSTGG